MLHEKVYSALNEKYEFCITSFRTNTMNIFMLKDEEIDIIVYNDKIVVQLYNKQWKLFSVISLLDLLDILVSGGTNE